MALFGSESKFESSVREIPCSQERVYAKLSDLSNIESVRERLPQDKVQDLEFDTDSVSISVQPVGKVTLRIIEREAPKCIKFEAEQSPVPFNMWIQLLPVTDDSCKMKLTIKAELNPFIKGMVSGPLQEGLEKISEMLAMINYQ
ncbi:MAG: SRPBCC family protein [Prevotella sp.]|nr:SRPBCC family protein [Prevotella sp.]MBQ9651483.1 SRPBCC family protein [Prevotella sp.]